MSRYEMRKAHLWITFCLALTADGHPRNDYGLDSLDNLGQRIQQSVRRQTSHLDGLGDRINQEVRQQTSYLDGLGARINTQVQESMSGLKTLDNLGANIQQQVHESLEPVRAIELNWKMKQGVGGTTIATYYPAERRFIIKSGQAFTCNGQIDMEKGTCSENLTPFSITPTTPKTDWCFPSTYSIVNNQICLGATSSVSVIVNNNQFTCYSTDGSPTFIMLLDQYKQLCSKVNERVEYKYFPNITDPSHVQVPNPNKYVKCEGASRNDFCQFIEYNNLLNVYSGNIGGVFVNNGAGYITSNY